MSKAEERRKQKAKQIEALKRQKETGADDARESMEKLSTALKSGLFAKKNKPE